MEVRKQLHPKNLNFRVDRARSEESRICPSSTEIAVSNRPSHFHEHIEARSFMPFEASSPARSVIPIHFPGGSVGPGSINRLPEACAIPRMPKLTIDCGLKAKCPGIALGLLVAQVTAHDTTAAFLEEMKSREREILTSSKPSAILESPTILSTRAGYKVLGKDPSRYRGSAEALLRRIISGKGLPQINTLVDIVNLVCVESRLPIGIYDLAKVKGSVVFRVGRPGESYRGIGKFDLNLEGLSVLSDEAGPHGSPTRDSERTMVTSSTEHATAIVISFGGTEGLEFAGERMTALLRQYADGRHIHYKIVS